MRTAGERPAPARAAGLSARCSAPQVRETRHRNSRCAAPSGPGASQPHSWGCRRRQVWGLRRGRSWSVLATIPAGGHRRGDLSGPCPPHPLDSVRGRVRLRPRKPPRGRARVNYYLLSRAANESGRREGGGGGRRMTRTISGSSGSDPGRAGRHGSGGTHGSAAGRWR